MILATFQVFNAPGEYIFNRDRIPFAESFYLYSIAIVIFLFILFYFILPAIFSWLETYRKIKKANKIEESKHISEKSRILYPYNKNGYLIVIYHSFNLTDNPARTSTKIKSLMIYPPNTLAYIDMEDNFRLVKDWCGYQVQEPYGPSNFTNPSNLEKLREEDFK